MRKCLPFLIIDANSPHGLQAPQKMSHIWMKAICPGYTQCKPCEGFKMYIGAGFCQNLEKEKEKKMHNYTMKESYATTANP